MTTTIAVVGCDKAEAHVLTSQQLIKDLLQQESGNVPVIAVAIHAEPDNPYDEKALSVYYGGTPIGHVSKNDYDVFHRNFSFEESLPLYWNITRIKFGEGGVLQWFELTGELPK